MFQAKAPGPAAGGRPRWEGVWGSLPAVDAGCLRKAQAGPFKPLRYTAKFGFSEARWPDPRGYAPLPPAPLFASWLVG